MISNILNIIRQKRASYYISIYDLPIYVFNEINETNNLDLLVKKGKLSDEFKQNLWININDQLLRKFGIPNHYKEYFRLRTKWMKELERIWVKGETYRKPFADQLKEDADKELTKTGNESFSNTMAIVSREMKQRIGPNTTVFEFYSYIQLLTNG